MKPQILLLFLLLATLAVVGYFVFRTDDTMAPGAQGSAAPVADVERQGENPDPASAELGDKPGESQPASAEAGVSRTAAPDVVAATADGTNLIRGRLVDLDAAPRAGVILAVAMWTTLGDLELVPMGSVNRRPNRQQCTTRSDGTFEVRVPKNKDGTFELEADDLVFAEKSPRFKAARGDQDVGDIVVVRSATLSGTVQDESGRPIADVKVDAQLGPMGFDTESSSKTNAEGKFLVGKLRPGKWTLRTASNAFLPTNEQIELAAEEQQADIVIVVKKGQAISGRVIDERGLGVAGMKVGCRRQEVISGMNIDRFSPDEAVTTDDSGYFTVSGLQGKTATVRAFGPGHTSVSKPGVAVGIGNLELRVQRYGSIEGVLVAADGTPIAGSRVSAVSTKGRSGAAGLIPAGDLQILDGRHSTRTDENGHFVLDKVSPGTVSVRARGKAHRPAEQNGVQVPPAQRVKSIRLVADAGAVARVLVVDPDDKPIAGAKVRIVRAPREQAGRPGMRMRTISVEDTGGDVMVSDGNAALGTAETDENGIATVMGLPSADAVVHAKHADFAPAAGVRKVLPAVGTVEAKLVLLEPGYVAVAVSKSDGGIAAGQHVVLKPVGAKNGAGGNNKAVTDAEGKVRFGPLASGEYTAVLSHGPRERSVGAMSMIIAGEQDTIRSSAQSVFVVGGKTTEVAMTIPVMTRFTGRVIGVEGPVVGCLVELESALESDGLPGLGGRSQKTAAEGTFSFDGVESGEYVVRYGMPEQVVRASIELNVPVNTPELQRELMLRTGSVRVQVLSKEDGEPIERAEVSLVRGGGDRNRRPQRRVMMFATVTTDGDGGEESTMMFGNKRTLTDADGVAVIEDVPVGTYTLRVENRKFSPGEKPEIVVVERQLTEVGTLELGASGQVRGQVLDGAGKRVPMAMVENRRVGTEPWSQGEMANGGSYRLQGLAPGRYEVRARPLGVEAGQAGEPVEVEITAGKTAVQDLAVGN